MTIPADSAVGDDWVEVGTDAPPQAAEPSSEPAAPVATPALPQSPSAETGLSDRAADSEDEPVAPERDAKGRWRNRARSQQATPADVPRIQKLTRELRQTQADFEAYKKQQSSPERQQWPTVAPAPVQPFNEPEPALEQFADKDDPYGAWQRELARYDRRRERHEEQSQHMRAHEQTVTQQVGKHWDGIRIAHQQRLIQAVQNNPQHYQALQAIQVAPPPVLDWAIMLDKQSADVALFLATHPHVLDEFALMTAVQPVTQATVATTQRLLRQRMTAAKIGSVAPSPVFPPAPAPPNPMRTAPMNIGETFPGDDDSLEAHEKAWPAGRVRRNR